MKAELITTAHTILPGVIVVEVHYNGRFVCAIYGREGPSIQISSKLKSDSKIRRGADGLYTTEITFPNIEHQ